MDEGKKNRARKSRGWEGVLRAVRVRGRGFPTVTPILPVWRFTRNRVGDPSRVSVQEGHKPAGRTSARGWKGEQLARPDWGKTSGKPVSGKQ